MDVVLVVLMEVVLVFLMTVGVQDDGDVVLL
jgi:hypothetical protein